MKTISSFLRYLKIIYLIPFFFIYNNAFPHYTLNLSTTNQTITGWGVSISSTSAKMIKSLKPEIRDSILNLCFGVNGLGFNILRIEIDPKFDYTLENWPDSLDADQYWLMTEAKARGVNNFLAIPCSPPAKFKANGKLAPDSIADTTNYLLQSSYDDYASYLSAYLRGYKSQRDIDINWISLQNSPDISQLTNSCKFSTIEYVQFLKIAAEKFKQENITINILAPNASGWNNTGIYLDSILNDDIAKQYITGIASQNNQVSLSYAYYPSSIVTKATDNKLKEIWATHSEQIIKDMCWDQLVLEPSNNMYNAYVWAKKIQGEFFNNGVTAWFFNEIVGFGSTDSSGILEYYNDSLIIPQRYWALMQYSKFIKPGYIVGAFDYTCGILSMIFLSPAKDTLILVSEYDFNDNIGFSQVLYLPDLCNMEYISQQWETISYANFFYNGSQSSVSGAFGFTFGSYSVATCIIPLIKNTNIPIVSLIMPQNNSKTIDSNQIFSWHSFPNAKSYVVFWGNNIGDIINEDWPLTTTFDTTLSYNEVSELLNGILNSMNNDTSFYWRVKALDSSFSTIACSDYWHFILSISDEVTEPIPGIRQAQGGEIIVIPNPTTQSATIKFDIDQPANVSLKLTDLLGNQITLIDNQFMDIGSHSVDWDASGVSAGVYYYVLEAGSSVKTGKVVVVK